MFIRKLRTKYIDSNPVFCVNTYFPDTANLLQNNYMQGANAAANRQTRNL